jgi:ribosome-associated protein
MEAWQAAIQAAQSRKAETIVVLNILEVSSFTEKFIICTGTNTRQSRAISDAIEQDLKQEGYRPLGVEGRQNGQWILMDYGDFLVHIFSPAARKFYDLERLWRMAPRVPISEAA